jgi:hypothetical protein
MNSGISFKLQRSNYGRLGSRLIRQLLAVLGQPADIPAPKLFYGFVFRIFSIFRKPKNSIVFLNYIEIVWPHVKSQKNLSHVSSETRTRT